MFLAIDVGGTKTLLAVFSKDGEIIKKLKIPTDHDYAKFLESIKNIAQGELKDYELTHCAVAIPGTLDFKNGIAVAFGSEDWRDVHIVQDMENLFPSSKLLFHNDAKLAALSEAILLAGKYAKVLYLTVSTGIGGGVIQNGKIDADFENFEPGQMVFEKDGRTMQWEDFASGRALKAKYGKMASEITDPEIWHEYSRNLTNGIENLIATIKPDVIVFGGGVGAHLDKFKSYLAEDLEKINNPLVPIPPILTAQRPEEAVIYGCYELIKQNI
jgi:predicted NBD/HSP70 family sugar kinase